MKAHFFIIFYLFSFFNVVEAQVYNKERGVRYSIGAEAGQAVNYLAKKHDKLLAISGQADFPIIFNELFATVNLGYNNVFVRENYSHLVDDMHVLPIKSGIKYFFNPYVYSQADLGVSFLLNKTNCVDGRNKAFVIAPQLGYLIYMSARNSIDLGLRFESTGKFYQCDKQNNFVGFRAAWSFSR